MLHVLGIARHHGRSVLVCEDHRSASLAGCGGRGCHVRLVDGVARIWHGYGMARIRVSTTVDGELLAGARRVRAGSPDSELLDEALNALIVSHRSAETDAAYVAYDDQPLDQPDEWGDLAAFRRAAGAS